MKLYLEIEAEDDEHCPKHCPFQTAPQTSTYNWHCIADPNTRRQLARDEHYVMLNAIQTKLVRHPDCPFGLRRE
jgi:hypothetical protein